jgi:hypothetical protein
MRRHDVAARFAMVPRVQRLRSATGGPGANTHEATMFIRVLCAATCMSMAAGCAQGALPESDDDPAMTDTIGADDGGVETAVDPWIAGNGVPVDYGLLLPDSDAPSDQVGLDPDSDAYEDVDPYDQYADGCTYSQGYWRTHYESWPATSLMLGSSYPAESAWALLLLESGGDASLVLAHQLIAALLNVASGASSIPEVGAAQEWLADHGDVLPYGISTDDPAGIEALELATMLMAYNEGAVGAGHCTSGL